MVKRKGRYLLQFRFWLDINKPDEEALADEIEILKNERGFSQAIRDGLRLVLSLGRGDTSVLFDLYPWIQARMEPQEQSLVIDYDEFTRMLQDHLGQKSAPEDNSSYRPLVTAPVFDDEDDCIEVCKDTSTDSAANFLNSVMNLQA